MVIPVELPCRVAYVCLVGPLDRILPELTNSERLGTYRLVFQAPQRRSPEFNCTNHKKLRHLRIIWTDHLFRRITKIRDLVKIGL